jgi:hypothetical protein
VSQAMTHIKATDMKGGNSCAACARSSLELCLACSPYVGTLTKGRPAILFPVPANRCAQRATNYSPRALCAMCVVVARRVFGLIGEL